MVAGSSSPAPRSVSFVVPAYNEERRLSDSLARLVEFAGGQPYSAEITVDAPGTYVVQLVVDDGTLASTADTFTISTEKSPRVG